MKITFFWVGAALQPTIDNSHFLIEDWDNKLQVDCSWWLSLAQRVKRKEIKIENIFISHTHTDHFLWFFHLLRTMPKETPNLNVYCSKKTEDSIRIIIKMIMTQKTNNFLDEWLIRFFHHDLHDIKNIWSFKLIPIDLNSNKTEQHWFLLESKWKKILFFWDEAVWILNRTDLHKFTWIDYLICEWLIPEKNSLKWWWKTDLDRMAHISAKQAWRIATKLNTKNLIIIHTMEKEDRVEELYEDASEEFDWNIFVPNDGDVIEIK